MPWYAIDVTDSGGCRFRDEILAFKEDEARVAVENLGYSINRIRLKPLKTFATSMFEAVDRRLRPYRYDYLRQLEDLCVEVDRTATSQDGHGKRGR